MAVRPPYRSETEHEGKQPVCTDCIGDLERTAPNAYTIMTPWLRSEM